MMQKTLVDDNYVHMRTIRNMTTVSTCISPSRCSVKLFGGSGGNGGGEGERGKKDVAAQVH